MYRGDTIIKRGHVSVKDDDRPFISSLFATWSKQYLSLNESLLLFHKNESTSSPSDIVSLSSIKNVSRTEDKEFCFMIESAKRGALYISCKSEAELYSWMDEIYKVSSIEAFDL